MSEMLEAHSPEQLIRRQDRELEQRRQELLEARERIQQLEDALRKVCEYADVCRHFPASEEARAS